MMKTMKVGELRELINGVNGDAEVLDISGSWCRVFTLGEDWVWEVVNYGR